MTDIKYGGPLAGRAMLSMERAEVEDRYLSAMEENLLLKKHVKSQEEKMKRMTTKLLRQAADEKREAKRNRQPLSVVQVQKLEGDMQDLVYKVRDLEKTNLSLQNKLQVLKYQSEAKVKKKRKPHFDHIQSRGLSWWNKKKSRSTEDIFMKRHRPDCIYYSPSTPRYGHSLLEEARKDNQKLEEQVLQLKEELSTLRAHNDGNQEQMRLRVVEHEQERLKLQHQLQTQLTTQQRKDVDEDVKLIRVQRELREKSSQLLTLHSQHSTMEMNLESMKIGHTKLLQEVEMLNNKVKEEQSRSIELQSLLNSSTITHRTVMELQEMVDDLCAERDLLKKANDRFTKRVLLGEGGEHRGKVRAMQERIQELETEQRAYLANKSYAVDKLSNEIEVIERLKQELRESHDAYGRLKTRHQQQQQKIQDCALAKECTGERGRVAVRGKVSVRGKKKAEAVSSDSPDPLGFLRKKSKSGLCLEVSELRSAHADTTAELEKTRQLLAAQRSINHNYKKEVKTLRSQIFSLHCEHSAQLSDHSQLLNMRSARLRQLESQFPDSSLHHTYPHHTGMRETSPVSSVDYPSFPPSPPHSHKHPSLHHLSPPSPPHSGKYPSQLPSQHHSSPSSPLHSHKHQLHQSVHHLSPSSPQHSHKHQLHQRSHHSSSPSLPHLHKNLLHKPFHHSSPPPQQSHKYPPYQHSPPPPHPHKVLGNERSPGDKKTSKCCGIFVKRESDLKGTRNDEQVERSNGELSKQSRTSDRNGDRKSSLNKNIKNLAEVPYCKPTVRFQSHTSVNKSRETNLKNGHYSSLKTKHNTSPETHKNCSSVKHPKVRPRDKASRQAMDVHEMSEKEKAEKSFGSPLRIKAPITSTPQNSQYHSPPLLFSSIVSNIADVTEVRRGRRKEGRETFHSTGHDRTSGGRRGTKVAGEEKSGSDGAKEEDSSSLSVTVPEMSEDEEDTMFEETISQQISGNVLSDSVPSSSLTPSSMQTRPTSDDGGSLVADDTSNTNLTTTQSSAGKLSIAILSFTVQPGCSLVHQKNASRSGYFVEFTLLDYDCAELETASVFTSLRPGHPLNFHFRKEFQVGTSQKQLLTSILHSTSNREDEKVVFILVSDPVEQDADCEELGTAQLDLKTVLLQQKQDPVSENLEVVSVDGEEEVLGQLSVCVQVNFPYTSGHQQHSTSIAHK